MNNWTRGMVLALAALITLTALPFGVSAAGSNILLFSGSTNASPGDVIDITTSIAYDGTEIYGFDHFIYYDPGVFEVVDLRPGDKLFVQELIPGDWFATANNAVDQTGGATHMSINMSGFAGIAEGYTGSLSSGQNSIYRFQLRVKESATSGTAVVHVGDASDPRRSQNYASDASPLVASFGSLSISIGSESAPSTTASESDPDPDPEESVTEEEPDPVSEEVTEDLASVEEDSETTSTEVETTEAEVSVTEGEAEASSEETASDPEGVAETPDPPIENEEVVKNTRTEPIEENTPVLDAVSEEELEEMLEERLDDVASESEPKSRMSYLIIGLIVILAAGIGLWQVKKQRRST